MTLVRLARNMTAQPKCTWQERAASKRAELLAQIPAEWRLPKTVLDHGREIKSLNGEFIESLLDAETRQITALNTTDILRMVREGRLTSLQTTSAFCKRTSIAHQLNNNVLSFCFESAFAFAAKLDEHFAKHKSTIGPLHGLPVSLKDQFHIKGSDTTMAYVGWIGTQGGYTGPKGELDQESELIRELYSLGAIPIAKSSPTQSLWCPETNNNIVGYNYNPNNQLLTSGGSSGGQAALQALRGTTVGFATDCGGSVTVPAAFNGLFSLKPSHGRISYRNAANSSPGQNAIPSVIGIYGMSVQCLQTTFQALMSTKPWQYDPEVVPAGPLASCEDLSTRKLSLGILPSDGMLTPHPPIARAIHIITKALKAKGHHLFDWDPPSHAEAADIHNDVTDADGAHDVYDRLALSGEPFIPELRGAFPEKPMEPISSLAFSNLVMRVRSYRERYLSYWESTGTVSGAAGGTDAVIMPAASHAAFIPGKWWTANNGQVPSVLDVPAVVIPVTTSSSKIDVKHPDFVPRNKEDEEHWVAYTSEVYDGAPASIVVLGGQRLGEEKLLAVAQVISDALEDYKGHEP